MCFKSPKAPEPPKVAPPPAKEAIAANIEAKGAKRRVEQQGIFSNIRTTALGDPGYGSASEAVRFGDTGAIA